MSLALLGFNLAAIRRGIALSTAADDAANHASKMRVSRGQPERSNKGALIAVSKYSIACRIIGEFICVVSRLRMQIVGLSAQ
jgi:hypothetical protein